MAGKERFDIHSESKIERVRSKYSISRRDLCNALNLPYRNVERWERGERIPPEYLEDLVQEIVDVRMHLSGDIFQPANAHFGDSNSDPISKDKD